jgi:protein-serine/threonine kinase
MGKGYDFSVDWWSMGAILFELLTGVPPFFADTPTEVFENVINYKKVLQETLEALTEENEMIITPVCWDFITKYVSPPYYH